MLDVSWIHMFSAENYVLFAWRLSFLHFMDLHAHRGFGTLILTPISVFLSIVWTNYCTHRHINRPEWISATWPVMNFSHLKKVCSGTSSGLLESIQGCMKTIHGLRTVHEADWHGVGILYWRMYVLYCFWTYLWIWGLGSYLILTLNQRATFKGFSDETTDGSSDQHKAASIWVYPRIIMSSCETICLFQGNAGMAEAQCVFSVTWTKSVLCLNSWWLWICHVLREQKD